MCNITVAHCYWPSGGSFRISTDNFHEALSFYPWFSGPIRAMASFFFEFLVHRQRHTTVGRTPLDEWSARRRDLYLTTHNTHNWPTPMPPVGFEPTISAGEWQQTYALDRAATGIGSWRTYLLTYSMQHSPSWEANWFAASQEIPRIFMEPEGSLPHSQVPATCPYLDPVRSSPCSHIPLPEDPS